MTEERTIFIKFDETWTHDELTQLMDHFHEALPDNVTAVAVPDSIEYMDGEQVEEFADNLVEVLK